MPHMEVQSYSPGGANVQPSWATRVHTSNGISTGSVVSAQLMAEGLYTLQWASPFPLKTTLVHEGTWTRI